MDDDCGYLVLDEKCIAFVPYKYYSFMIPQKNSAFVSLLSYGILPQIPASLALLLWYNAALKACRCALQSEQRASSSSRPLPSQQLKPLRD